MKLSGGQANGYLRKPDPNHAGLLIYGADPMRVATKRQEAILSLLGPTGEEEMRLTRINGADLRKDPALVNDAIKAQGFFPGHRVAFVEDATDTLAKTLTAALADWEAGDAQVVVTAGQLAAKSALRKLFEAHPAAVAIGIYDDPPSRDEIESTLANAGLAPPARDVMDAVFALAQSLEPGDFRQTIEKVGLYKLGGPTLRNLYAQGVLPVTLCIMAMRHFRRLHVVASDPGGPGAGVGRLRPPVFGPRRDKIARQAGNWGRDRLEKALTALTDTDLQMRSANPAPMQALMERTLIRLSMMARR